jgi:hypothetical protein
MFPLWLCPQTEPGVNRLIVDISEAVRSMVVNVRRSTLAVSRACKNSRQAAALGRGLLGPDENLCNALSEQLVRSDNT